MDILVGELAPETDFRSEDIFLVSVGLNHLVDVDVVYVEPGEIVAVGDSEVVAYAHVEIEGSVL